MTFFLCVSKLDWWKCEWRKKKATDNNNKQSTLHYIQKLEAPWRSCVTCVILITENENFQTKLVHNQVDNRQRKWVKNKMKMYTICVYVIICIHVTMTWTLVFSLFCDYLWEAWNLKHIQLGHNINANMLKTEWWTHLNTYNSSND